MSDHLFKELLEQNTVFVPLPSRGLVYPQDSNLYKLEEIEITPMTGKEEDILTSLSLAKKGIILIRLLQSVVKDVTIKKEVENLIYADFNAILIALRITGRGGQIYKFGTECANCGNKFMHSVNLNELELKELFESDIDNIGENQFNFTVGYKNKEYVFQIKLLTYKESEGLTKDYEKISNKLSNESLSSNDITEKGTTNRLKKYIISIDGETDRNIIDNVIEHLPSGMIQEIESKIDAIEPGINLSIPVECPDCSTQFLTPMIFTAEFFRPRK